MKNDNLKEITDKLEKGVKDVFESDKYKAYLTCMSKFYKYSVNNIMLIMMQKPDATLVAGYKAWQTKFNRHVRKGEKGITILAPCPHKIEKEDEDGNKNEIRWTTFRATKVFDISQTDGEELPAHYVGNMTGDVADYEVLIAKLKCIAPVPVEFQYIDGGANGFYSRADKKIAVMLGMSEIQTVKTLIHEIAHATLHCKDGVEENADRLSREVQAESIAYTVCSMLGLDTGDYSFGYVAGWSSDKDVKELIASMEVIRSTAKDMYEKIAA